MGLQLAENWKYLSTAELPGQFTAMGSSATVIAGELQVLNGSAANAYNSFTLIGAPQGTIIVNLRMTVGFTGAPDTGFYVIQLIDTATVQCGLALRTSDRKLFFWRNTDATQIGPNSTNALTDGVTYDIEVKIVLGNTGTVECRVNGFVEIPPTTVDNTNTVNNTCTVVRVCSSRFAGMAGTNRLIHCVILDGSGASLNDFLGVVDVNLHAMNAAGAHSALARGGTDLGANYKQVNEVPPNEDTSYVGGGSAGLLDTYGMTDLPAGVTVVYAVGVVFRARRDDAAARGVSPVIRSGGVDYVGTQKAMSSSYNFFTHWWPVNPNTSAPFTVTQVNNLEAGMKITL